MNIFLAFENWLDEVKGMSAKDIFNAAHILSDMQKKVHKALKDFISESVGTLKKDSTCAEKLVMGDYNK